MHLYDPFMMLLILMRDTASRRRCTRAKWFVCVRIRHSWIHMIKMNNGILLGSSTKCQADSVENYTLV